MPAVEFHWSPHEDEPFEVAADLRSAATFLDNIRPPLEAARELTILDIKDHFDTQSGPDGAWEAIGGLSAEESAFRDQKPGGYAHAKERRGGSGSILVDTGAGKAVATSRSSFEVVASGPEGFLAFSADPPHFMMTHNRGAMDRETWGGFYEGPNPLPKREWLWLSEQASLEIAEVFDLWVQGAINIVTGGAGGVAVMNISGTFFGFGSFRGMK